MGTVPIYLLARFPAESLLSLRSRNHARFSLQTVFSITHSDHLIPHIELSAVTEIEMLT